MSSSPLVTSKAPGSGVLGSSHRNEAHNSIPLLIFYVSSGTRHRGGISLGSARLLVVQPYRGPHKPEVTNSSMACLHGRGVTQGCCRVKYKTVLARLRLNEAHPGCLSPAMRPIRWTVPPKIPSRCATRSRPCSVQSPARPTHATHLRNFFPRFRPLPSISPGLLKYTYIRAIIAHGKDRLQARPRDLPGGPRCPEAPFVGVTRTQKPGGPAPRPGVLNCHAVPRQCDKMVPVQNRAEPPAAPATKRA